MPKQVVPTWDDAPVLGNPPKREAPKWGSFLAKTTPKYEPVSDKPVRRPAASPKTTDNVVFLGESAYEVKEEQLEREPDWEQLEREYHQELHTQAAPPARTDWWSDGEDDDSYDNYGNAWGDEDY